ncbi:rna-directed dna polymerase from mobile element jockey- hypothetical protein [Limosa lapponica baueri]|uniref:Rna-directed dna polymerase from mobile element jockey-like n=1 Tax=Limosa lapponica baueri TaxID=1758121 RepID=A0A2I0UGG2_LIMLA|nr:rna-directed dna polymerase from mobile element jockey- hypothetical protein [Limosa lapponica baueri]
MDLGNLPEAMRNSREHSNVKEVMAIREVPVDQKKANFTAIFNEGKEEELGNYNLVSLTSVPGKVMEQVSLENIAKHMKGKKVTRSIQHGFMKRRLCLTNPIDFCDRMPSLVDEQREVDVVFLTLARLLTFPPIKSS